MVNEDTETTIQGTKENLERINDWAKNWLVIFNPRKTKGVKFTSKRQPEELRITMGNTKI